MKAPPAMPISFNQLPVSCMGWAMNTGTQVSRSNNTIINPNSSAASRALQLVAMHSAGNDGQGDPGPVAGSGPGPVRRDRPAEDRTRRDDRAAHHGERGRSEERRVGTEC